MIPSTQHLERRFESHRVMITSEVHVAWCPPRSECNSTQQKRKDLDVHITCRDRMCTYSFVAIRATKHDSQTACTGYFSPPIVSLASSWEKQNSIQHYLTDMPHQHTETFVMKFWHPGNNVNRIMIGHDVHSEKGKICIACF